MATQFRKGDTVRLKAVLPQGPVEKLRMDEDGVFYYMITWTDADSVVRDRWFREDELQLVE